MLLQLHMKNLLKVLLKTMMYQIQKILLIRKVNKTMQDELEIMVTQELAAKAMDDVSRQAFEEEKRRIASQKKAAQAIQLYQNIVRYAILLVLIGPQLVLISALLLILDGLTPPMCLVLASTPTGANAHESSFVYLGGKIPIDASTLPNADLPIDPNMPDLEDASDTLPNDGIFNGAYRENHKINPKGQSFRDPTSAVQKQEGRFKKLSPAQITQALVKEPNTISQALQDESWVEAIARRIASFKLTEGGYLLIFPYWEKEFEECMHKRFQMSSIGELTFFLGLQVKQQPDGIFISQDKSYEAPLPEGNISGSTEASIQLKELIVLVPNLVTRVTSLEKELKETKQTLGNVVLKLVKKVKSLEIALKRKSKKVIMSALEGEEPEDRRRIIQDIDDDPLVSLVRESMK
ncbi:hypothetical protein Tco_0111356 [Tanacetum coccineum]